MKAKQKTRTSSESESLLDYQALSSATQLGIPFLKKAKAEYNLPYYKIGHLVRFRLSEVELWLKERKAC